MDAVFEKGWSLKGETSCIHHYKKATKSFEYFPGTASNAKTSVNVVLFCNKCGETIRLWLYLRKNNRLAKLLNFR